MYENYNVKKSSLSSLTDKSIDLSEIQFKVFIGLWCSDSRIFFPKFIKIIENLKLIGGSIQIVSVDKYKKKPIDLLQKYQIKYLPTVVVFKENVELNRIVEFENLTIEEDLIKILLNEEYLPFRH